VGTVFVRNGDAERIWWEQQRGFRVDDSTSELGGGSIYHIY
jgi:hypothetical protein